MTPRMACGVASYSRSAAVAAGAGRNAAAANFQAEDVFLNGGRGELLRRKLGLDRQDAVGIPRAGQGRLGRRGEESFEHREDDLRGQIARADLQISRRAAHERLVPDAQDQKVAIGPDHRVQQRAAHRWGQHRHLFGPAA